MWVKNLSQGSGTESLGTMVPILEAASVQEADRICAFLNSESIPALVQNESEPAALGIWLPSAKRSGAFVIVPSTMRDEAVKVLRSTREKPAVLVLRAVPDGWLKTQKLDEPAPEIEERTPQDSQSSQTESDELEDEPIEPELPESGPLLTRMMVAGGAIVLFSMIQSWLTEMYGERTVLRTLAASPEHLGEWWRFVSASFLHSSWSHHYSNAAFGLLLGVVLFGTHGFGATMLTWLLSSAVGLLTEISSVQQTALVLGASAGNYGLVGLWARGHLDRSLVSALPKRERMKTLGILVLLIPGAFTPVSAYGSRIAVFAHAGGFLFGFLLGYVFKRNVLADEQPKIVLRSRFAMVLAVGIVLAAGVFAGQAIFHL